MEITKENLQSLHLVQLKKLCKDYHINHGGTKTQLITRILEANKPITPVMNSHPSSLTPPDKKIIGVMYNESEKGRQIGKQIEIKKGSFLYYAVGVRYYVVDKDFEFIS